MTVEEEAQALLDAVIKERHVNPLFHRVERDKWFADEALCRTIEAKRAVEDELAAFKREVSEKVTRYHHYWRGKELAPNKFNELFSEYVIKPPVDPLVAAMADCGVDPFESWADQLRAALSARNLRVVDQNGEEV